MARSKTPRDTVRELLEEGLPPRAVAARLGCHPRTVLRVQHELGLPVAPGPSRRLLTEEDHAVIRECLAEGMPFAEITATYGYSHQTLARHYPGQGMPPVEIGRLAAAINRANRQLARNHVGLAS